MNKLHRQVHHHLKLQHHKHTGRVLHHKHTSYRGLAVVFVLAGAFMLGLAAVQRSAADTPFSVSAVVPVPVPKVGAVISLPQADSMLTSADNLVAGSCPVASPQVAIVLLVDGTQAGSALCNDSNNFAMPMRFTPGEHTLVAQSYTLTGGKAPDSAPVQVTSRATQPAASTNVTLTGTDPFNVLEGSLATAWDGTITGGKAPYHLIVDWGDGKSDRYTVTLASQHLTHTYPSLQSYNARIAVSDDSGLSTQLQYATVAYTTPAQTPAATNAAPLFTPTVAGLYGLFITVVSVSGIIWLEAKHALRHELALGRV